MEQYLVFGPGKLLLSNLSVEVRSPHAILINNSTCARRITSEVLIQKYHFDALASLLAWTCSVIRVGSTQLGPHLG